MAEQIAPSIERLTALLQGDVALVNDVIMARMASDVPMIPELASHLIAAGGKRMRPMLTLAGARAVTGNQAKADSKSRTERR